MHEQKKANIGKHVKRNIQKETTSFIIRKLNDDTFKETRLAWDRANYSCSKRVCVAQDIEDT